MFDEFFSLPDMLKNHQHYLQSLINRGKLKAAQSLFISTFCRAVRTASATGSVHNNPKVKGLVNVARVVFGPTMGSDLVTQCMATCHQSQKDSTKTWFHSQAV